ncbi:MAG: hypothetical protein ACT4OZ_00155 [Gemmatimonadota bacterium]
MRTLLILGLAAVVACSRQVRVETAPSAGAASASLRVTNNASQAISIYVQGSGPELFLRQVPPNTTEIVPVAGIAEGTTVKLRATLADGSQSYTRNDVVLRGSYDWRVP